MVAEPRQVVQSRRRTTSSAPSIFPSRVQYGRRPAPTNPRRVRPNSANFDPPSLGESAAKNFWRRCRWRAKRRSRLGRVDRGGTRTGRGGAGAVARTPFARSDRSSFRRQRRRRLASRPAQDEPQTRQRRRLDLELAAGAGAGPGLAVCQHRPEQLFAAARGRRYARRGRRRRCSQDPDDREPVKAPRGRESLLGTVAALSRLDRDSGFRKGPPNYPTAYSRWFRLYRELATLAQIAGGGGESAKSFRFAAPFAGQEFLLLLPARIAHAWLDGAASDPILVFFRITGSRQPVHRRCGDEPFARQAERVVLPFGTGIDLPTELCLATISATLANSRSEVFPRGSLLGREHQHHVGQLPTPFSRF